MPIERATFVAQFGAAPGPIACLIVIAIFLIAVGLAVTDLVMIVLLLRHLVMTPPGEIGDTTFTPFLYAPVAAGLLAMIFALLRLRSAVRAAITVLGIVAAGFSAMRWRDYVPA